MSLCELDLALLKLDSPLFHLAIPSSFLSEGNVLILSLGSRQRLLSHFFFPPRYNTRNLSPEPFIIVRFFIHEMSWKKTFLGANGGLIKLIIIFDTCSRVR